MIHTVGPIWRGGAHDEAATLRRCYRSCFAIAEARGLASIAFPSISTGASRYPLAEAVPIAVEEIRAALARLPSLKVTVACFGPAVLAAYRDATDAR